MSKSDKLIVSHSTARNSVINSREYLPVVVGVIERITRDLLTLTGHPAIVISQRIPVRVTVKISLSLLVSEHDIVVIFDANRICCHQIVGQGLLELGRHEVVSWA